MIKSEKIKAFQILVAEEIKKEVPKTSSEVKAHSIGSKLLSSIKKISLQTKKA
ncbi:MAG: hypothetical protein HZB30_07310 [Nitrospirae bacterium]|nr:hypothetical protein [Nitrospirota bacterium]